MLETKGLEGHPGNNPPFCSLPTCRPRTPRHSVQSIG